MWTPSACLYLAVDRRGTVNWLDRRLPGSSRYYHYPAGLRHLLSPRRPKYRLVHPIVYDRILSCRVATSLSRSLRFSAASSFIRTSCDPSPVAPVSVESLCVALSSTGPSPRCNLLCRSSLSAIFNLKACAPMSSGCTMLPARVCCWALVQLVRGASSYQSMHAAAPICVRQWWRLPQRRTPHRAPPCEELYCIVGPIYLNQTTMVHRAYKHRTSKSPRHIHAHTAHLGYTYTHLSHCNKNTTGNTWNANLNMSKH